MKALQFDKDLPEAHTSLAAVLWLYDWNWLEAQTEFKRSLQLAPAYPNVNHWFAEYLMTMGRFDDAITQMLWRQVQAKVLARRDEPDEAERLACEAIAIGAETDMPSSLGDAYSDLAEVLTLAHRATDAHAALQQALALYERKGDLVMVERTQTKLRELPDAGD
jgi:tetratricopeptide (TPR) repeat protein